MSVRWGRVTGLTEQQERRAAFLLLGVPYYSPKTFISDYKTLKINEPVITVTL